MEGDGASWGDGRRQTDGKGEARWTGIYSQKRTIAVRLDPDTRGAVNVGTVDFATGDPGTGEYTLPRMRTFTLDTTINGKPGLPPDFRISVNRRRARIVYEDPALGRVRAEYLDNRKWLSGSLSARGFRGGDFEEPWTADTPPRFAIRLSKLGTLVARIENSPPGEYYSRRDIQIQRWDEARHRWSDALITFALHRPDRHEPLRVPHVRAGRYRLVHTDTGSFSNTVNLAPGETAPMMRLSVGPTYRISGRLELPEGVRLDPEGLRVLVAGSAHKIDQDPHQRRGRRLWESSFEFDVVGAQRRTLRAFHPILGAGAPAQVTPPARDVVLTLPDAPRIRFSAQPPPPPRRVYLTTGHGRSPKQADEIMVLVKDGDVFASWPFEWTEYRNVMTVRVPSRRKLWIDLPGLAPRLLGDLPEEPGLHDLGTVRFVRGGSIAVRVLRHPHADICFVATFLGRPRYTRKPRYRPDIVGLGPGRFRIEGTAKIGEDRILFSTEVTLGENERKVVSIRIP